MSGSPTFPNKPAYGDDDRIIFIPYENYLRIRTRTMPDFLSGMKEDKECVVTSLLLSTFHSRFELCLPETERIEEIRNKAIKLSKEKKNQLAAEYDAGDLYLLFVFGVTMAFCGLLLILHTKYFGSLVLFFGIPLCIIGVIILIFMIKRSILNSVNDKKNLKLLLKYEGIFKEILFVKVAIMEIELFMITQHITVIRSSENSLTQILRTTTATLLSKLMASMHGLISRTI